MALGTYVKVKGHVAWASEQLALCAYDTVCL